LVGLRPLAVSGDTQEWRGQYPIRFNRQVNVSY
jgi:hypothetical protein